jgi:hypothetical protein
MGKKMLEILSRVCSDVLLIWIILAVAVQPGHIQFQTFFFTLRSSLSAVLLLDLVTTGGKTTIIIKILSTKLQSKNKFSLKYEFYK